MRLLISSNKTALLALALVLMLVGNHVVQAGPPMDDEDEDPADIEEASGNDGQMDEQAQVDTTVFDRRPASSTSSPAVDLEDDAADTDDDDNDDLGLDAPPSPDVNSEIGSVISAPSKEIVPAYESSTPPQVTYQSTRSKLLAIISKPGILAGIVGGAVIGILTAILLIMFIVYRMRKKDEGSYALEETKKPLSAYDYRHCPTKEFYA